MNEVQLDLGKDQLELARIFDATSSFNKFWNTKVLSKEPKFNGVYSKNSLPKIKDGAYVINLDEYESIGTHWILKTYIALFAESIENLKNLKYHISYEKHLLFLLLELRARMEMKKHLKKKT